MVGMLLTGVLHLNQSTVVGDNQRTYFGDTTLFLNQRLLLCICFRLALHTLCCFHCKQITASKRRRKELGLTFVTHTQHGEFYEKQTS
jgi:hypothetical protein